MSPIAKMRVKVVYTYPSPIKYVPDGYKAKKSVIDSCPFLFPSVPHRHKSEEIYDKVVSEESFMQKYCLDRQKT